MSNSTSSTSSDKLPKGDFRKNSVFGPDNYKIFFVGLAVLILGFALMAGGGSDDPNEFNTEAIYSFRRITLAPIVVLTGFAIEIFAVFRRPRS